MKTKNHKFTSLNFGETHKEKIQEILDNLEVHGINERVGLHADINNELGSELINPVIILPKGET